MAVHACELPHLLVFEEAAGDPVKLPGSRPVSSPTDGGEVIAGLVALPAADGRDRPAGRIEAAPADDGGEPAGRVDEPPADHAAAAGRIGDPPADDGPVAAGRIALPAADHREVPADLVEVANHQAPDAGEIVEWPDHHVV